MSNNNSLIGRVATGSGQNDLRGYISPDAGNITFEQLDAELQEAIRLAETALQPSDIEGVVIDANYVHTDNNFTTNYKNILDNFDPGGGGFTQVQVDWNEADQDSIKFIKNKPVIPAAQVQSDWNEDNTTSKAYILHKPDISGLADKNGSEEEDFNVKDLYINNVGAGLNVKLYLEAIDDEEYYASITDGRGSGRIARMADIPDVSGKADKNEMSVTPGTEADADKVTITLKSGMSATVLKQHQSLSGLAPVSSPSFTGVPEAPTAQQGTDTNQIATTKFVNAAVSSGSGKTVGVVTVVNAEEITVQHGDVCGVAPLYVFDCNGDGIDAEIELTGNFSDGDSFYFIVKAGTDSANINSTQANLHETGNTTGVSSLDVSSLCVEYSLCQMVYTSLGWIMR